MIWIKAVAAVLVVIGSAQAAATTDGQPNDAMLSFTACRKAIAEAAKPYTPLIIEATITGPIQRLFGGTRVTTLFVRIVYDRLGGHETRRAHVTCTVDSTGVVTIEPRSP